jgi:hypothetical protein
MTGPQRFKSKPVEISAMQWTGDAEGLQALHAWMIELGVPETAVASRCFISIPQEDTELTLQVAAGAGSSTAAQAGWSHLQAGDWVILEAQSHRQDGQASFYPCKAVVFPERYEPLP